MKDVILSKPLTWGGRTIETVTMRRPMSGDLRGIKIAGISEMDVNTILALVPRISMVPMPAQVVNDIDPADVVALGEAISGFFTPEKRVETDSSTQSQTTPPSPGES